MLVCPLCLVIFDFMLGTVFENSILFLGNTHDKYRNWHCFTFFNFLNAWLNLTHTDSHIYFCFTHVVISHIPQSLKNCTYSISKVKRRNIGRRMIKSNNIISAPHVRNHLFKQFTIETKWYNDISEWLSVIFQYIYLCQPSCLLFPIRSWPLLALLLRSVTIGRHQQKHGGNDADFGHGCLPQPKLQILQGALSTSATILLWFSFSCFIHFLL